MTNYDHPSAVPYHPSLHPPRNAAPRSDALRPETPRPAGPRSLWGKVRVILEMIKFRHSVFALPFALASMVVAAGGWPSLRTISWIIVACVAARSMAMTFNRLADRGYDARNPRTRDRALPAGLVTVSFASAFAVVAAALFVFASAMLNRLCFFLSPLAIVVLLGYSFCKRFTEGVHVALGVALGLAPLGAWIAVRGSLDALPVLLAMGVVFWTAGFDIIYSCLDVECDRRENLHSLAARFGIVRALRAARWFHVFAVVCLVLFVVQMRLGPWSALALAVVSVLLFLEHSLVRAGDLSRVGPAFFTFNAWVSVVFFLGCAMDTMAGVW